MVKKDGKLPPVEAATLDFAQTKALGEAVWKKLRYADRTIRGRMDRWRVLRLFAEADVPFGDDATLFWCWDEHNGWHLRLVREGDYEGPLLHASAEDRVRAFDHIRALQDKLVEAMQKHARSLGVEDEKWMNPEEATPSIEGDLLERVMWYHNQGLEPAEIDQYLVDEGRADYIRCIINLLKDSFVDRT